PLRRIYPLASAHHRNYWPGLLRLRSGIIELSFSRKARSRAVCRSELHSAITAPKFCASASSLFSMPCRNNGAVGNTRKGARIVVASTGGQERGRRPGLSRIAKSTYLQVCSLRPCAKLWSVERTTEFTPKPLEN